MATQQIQILSPPRFWSQCIGDAPLWKIFLNAEGDRLPPIDVELTRDGLRATHEKVTTGDIFSQATTFKRTGRAE